MMENRSAIRHRLIAVIIGAAALAATARAAAEETKLLPSPDLFETLVNPNCSHVIDEVQRRPGELKPDERVLSWIRGYREGGGIPYRFFFSKYPVISDTYGVFVCDADAGFAIGFEPSLEFTFHGWRNGVIVMRHKDGTLFSTLSGVAFDGPRKGEKLKRVPTIAATWGYWARAYPDSVTYQLYDKYSLIDFDRKKTRDLSRRSRGEAAPALAAEEEVLGLDLPGGPRAYRIADLARSDGVVRDRAGDRDLVILWYAPTRTAAAYAPRTDGEGSAAVTIEHDGSDPIAPFRDRETSSWWGIEGRARSGPLAGKTLEWLPAVQCRWFAWSAEYPATEVRKPADSSGAR